jgi:hypothetical protein
MTQSFSIVCIAVLGQALAFSQAPPKQAVDIRDADVKEVLKGFHRTYFMDGWGSRTTWII